MLFDRSNLSFIMKTYLKFHYRYRFINQIANEESLFNQFIEF